MGSSLAELLIGGVIRSIRALLNVSGLPNMATLLAPDTSLLAYGDRVAAAGPLSGAKRPDVKYNTTRQYYYFYSYRSAVGNEGRRVSLLRKATTTVKYCGVR